MALSNPAIPYADLMAAVDRVLQAPALSAELIGSPEIDLATKNSGIAEDMINRRAAHCDGVNLLTKWLSDPSRAPVIQDLLENPIQPTATTFNDLYKWTMTPVIRQMESYFSDMGDASTKTSIIVTFGIDLRDNEEDAIRLTLKTNAGLQENVYAALKTLTTRAFSDDVFTALLADPRFSTIFQDDPNGGDTKAAITMNNGTPRMLAQHVNPGSPDAMFTVANYDALKTHPSYVAAHRNAKENGDVSLLFYKNESAVYKEGEAGGLVFIEAVGPWHRVTWLETSMMQCVYEANLKHTLPTPEEQVNWLAGALIRCAKGVAYSRLIQDKANPTTHRPTPALFSGRRIGSYTFMLLQVLFFSDHFKQFPTGLESDYEKGNPSKTLCLGTSSVDSVVALRKKRQFSLNTVGTHAHELSMVSSALFPERDEIIPGISQVIGHYIYFEKVWKKTMGIMPMLPDTWGTRVFLHAANRLLLEDGKSLLSKINSARQDSGSLADFKANVNDFGYGSDAHTLGVLPPKTPPVRTMMASEVDSTKTFCKSKSEGYANGGIGGFFGDSIKVWGNSSKPAGSMAVKAVEVRYIPMDNSKTKAPYIQVEGDHRVAYPVKIGDPENRDEPALKEGKLSLTRNLPPDTLEKIKKYVSNIRVDASRAKGAPYKSVAPEAVGNNSITENSLAYFFKISDGSMEPSSNTRNLNRLHTSTNTSTNGWFGLEGLSRRGKPKLPTGGNRRQSRRRGQQKQRQSRRQRQQQQKQRQSRRQRQQQRQRQTR